MASLTLACGTPYLPARMPADVAQPAGSKHDQGEFMGVGKNALYWQSWQPTTTRKRGVLVVMHGLKDHSARYADFAHTLNQAGYAVYAFDMRGHGESAGDRVGVLLFDDYVMDLDVFLHRVMSDERDIPIFVFGHSMGGAIATLEEIEYHPAINGLILSGAALEPGVSNARIGLTRFTASIDPDLAAFNLDLEKFSRDPAVVEAAKHDPLVYQNSATVHMATKLIEGIQKIDANMERVDVPILILHGKADQVTPPSGSQALYARASSKDKSLQLYGKMFHDLLHEPEKGIVTNDIVTWLDARTQ
jgi:alpha-beta hydrolase superfamily lysophospholipase